MRMLKYNNIRTNNKRALYNENEQRNIRFDMRICYKYTCTGTGNIKQTDRSK
jgi:hypothetical protein